MVGKNSLKVCLAMVTVVAMFTAMPATFMGATTLPTSDSITVENGQLVVDRLVLGERTFAIHGDLDDRALYLDGAPLSLGGIVPWWISGLEADGSIHLVIGDAAYRTFLSHYVVSADGGETWDVVVSFEGCLKPHIAAVDGVVYVSFERTLDNAAGAVYMQAENGFEAVRDVPDLSYADVLDYRMTEEYLAYDLARKYEMVDRPATTRPGESVRAETKEWAYIYVCNGEASGIESYLEADATEMAAGGSSANHWAICLFDDNGAGTNQVRVMNVGGGGYTSFTMAQVGLSSEPNLGDPATFITFLDWCFANYPGINVVWDNGGHGGGTAGCIFDETPVDDISLTEITTLANGLVTALEREVNITAWDTCITQTQEWLYGYKPITDFTVASMDNRVGAGFNYEGLMDYLAANTPTVDEMANEIADQYWTGEGAYISAVDMNNWDYTFMPTFNNLCQELRHGSYITQINTAWTNAFYPGTAPNHDVWGWMNNINTGVSNPTVQALALSARNQVWTANYPSGLADAVLVEYGTDVDHHGLGDEKVANTAWKIDIETIRNEMMSQSSVSNVIPTCTVSSPSAGADVPMDGTVTIQGTATDSVGVTRVEVKINREWWQVATGTTSWSFNWDVTSDVAYYGLGTYKISARSYDGTDYSNYQSINVNVIESYGSAGVVQLDKTTYLLEDSVHVTVTDGDLTAPSITVNVKSTNEPVGETLTLLATAPQGKYEGTITASATNSAGVLMVAHGNTITATYNDANDGVGPATVTDTATVDGQVGAPSGLTVDWTGTSSATLISQDFSSTTFPPTGWAQSGPTSQWTRQTTANAGGTSPEARFGWVSNTNTWRLYAGPLNTAGMSNLALSWNNYYDDYGAGVTVKVQTSSDGTTWHDGGWSVVSGTGNVGPALVTRTLSTADVGSATFYLAFTVEGNAYQLDYWYIDNVLVTYTGGATTDDNLLDWTPSADDGAGANDVANYNIYRATTSAGPWDSGALVTSVAAGVSTYTDMGRGEFDGTNWWYVVRAEDVWGNEDTNAVAVPEVAPANVWANITVVAGWNLISVPLVGTTTMPTALLDKTGGVVWTRALWYNPATPADPWKQYNSAWTSSLNDLTMVDNVRGVWLFVTTAGDGQICVGGTGYSTPVSTGILLKTGWNLVGFPSDDTTFTVANLKGACPTVTLVEQYSSGQTYLTVAMADATAFAQGKAYWIFNNGADATWTKAW